MNSSGGVKMTNVDGEGAPVRLPVCVEFVGSPKIFLINSVIGFRFVFVSPAFMQKRQKKRN